MKKELEEAGYFVHTDIDIAFGPFDKYCAKKGKYLEGWMYMYHDCYGIHYYKHSCTRNYIEISINGLRADSILFRFWIWLRASCR
ncbi:hypothetical protein [Paenibacillus agricola]|uniref:Uncharacterized protein n=1 Tax=Paenibacillus agricola TaxID=2716264 RepID=A0ABX0JC48_9BACL|nr:hypothetical protein [Paenibacillus agricola]NHN33138.1 hypothetical protein [Paenibacillus agricola]